MPAANAPAEAMAGRGRRGARVAPAGGDDREPGAEEQGGAYSGEYQSLRSLGQIEGKPGKREGVGHLRAGVAGDEGNDPEQEHDSPVADGERFSRAEELG